MVDYPPFRATLKKKEISTYRLIKCEDISFSNSTVQRIRRGQGINFGTLGDLCWFLDCRIEDIIRYVPGDPPRKKQNTKK